MARIRQFGGRGQFCTDQPRLRFHTFAWVLRYGYGRNRILRLYVSQHRINRFMIRYQCQDIICQSRKLTEVVDGEPDATET